MYPSFGDGCLARPHHSERCNLLSRQHHCRREIWANSQMLPRLYDGDMGMGHLWLKLMMGYLRLNGGAFMTWMGGVVMAECAQKCCYLLVHVTLLWVTIEHNVILELWKHQLCCCEVYYCELCCFIHLFSAGTPPLGSSTGMTTFSNLPNRNLPFTLTLNVQPRCGQATFDVTRQFRRGMNGNKYTA